MKKHTFIQANNSILTRQILENMGINFNPCFIDSVVENRVTNKIDDSYITVVKRNW